MRRRSRRAPRPAPLGLRAAVRMSPAVRARGVQRHGLVAGRAGRRRRGRGGPRGTGRGRSGPSRCGPGRVGRRVLDAGAGGASVPGGARRRPAPAWARWALGRTAWPVLLGEDEPQSGGTLGRLQAARRVLAALAGFDPGDPVAVLAYQLPGFEAQQGLGGGGAAAARWRFAAGPGPGRVFARCRRDRQRAPAAAPAASSGTVRRRRAGGARPAGLRRSRHRRSRRSSRRSRSRRRKSRPSMPGCRSRPWSAFRPVAWGDDCRVLIYHTHTSEMYRTDSFAPRRSPSSTTCSTRRTRASCAVGPGPGPPPGGAGHPRLPRDRGARLAVASTARTSKPGPRWSSFCSGTLTSKSCWTCTGTRRRVW